MAPKEVADFCYLPAMASLVHKRLSWIGAGTTFSLLWASASSATKIGLTAAQPLTLAVMRFGIAASIMLFSSHVIGRNRLPSGKEWKQLAIYGLLNIAIYLGCYVVAMQTVTAGIGALATATNPVFILFLSLFVLKKKPTASVILAILLGTAGVWCAAWPLLGGADVTAKGLAILFFSMLSYSAGAIYFAGRKWNGLHLFTINGWQTLMGGLMLLPFAWWDYQAGRNSFHPAFWGSVLWLAVPVSILAVQLWLWLLQSNAVKAGLWLFLCPLFGFVFAAWLLNDPISGYTVAGVGLVIAGLVIAQRDART